jgi:hypothetical protein
VNTHPQGMELLVLISATDDDLILSGCFKVVVAVISQYEIVSIVCVCVCVTFTETKYSKEEMKK